MLDMEISQKGESYPIGGYGNMKRTSSALIIGIALLATLTPGSSAQPDTTQPDWTVAYCGATHVPAYTRTDMCVTSAGVLVSVPLTAAPHTQH